MARRKDVADRRAPDASEVILALAPETNGEVAVKAAGVGRDDRARARPSGKSIKR